MPLQKVTPATMFTLLSLASGPRHGYAILTEVERRSSGRVRLGPSSLYYTLGRLADAGLIEESPALAAEADEPHADQRRTFSLTREGLERLESELQLLTDLVDQARALGLAAGG